MDYQAKTKKRKLGTTDDCTAGTSSSSSASGGKFEVFLSFRGNDTRKGFTDYLYYDLVDAGIRTFRDDDELRVGEEIGPEILKAIEESKICIPIFSKSYASSKWCFLELAQMFECQKKSMGHQVLPIFYDVEPHHVRHQTGTYEDAFRQHEKRFDEKTVEGWKEALREVAELKGWELEKETNGHQGKLVKIIVSKVLLELKKNYMVVTENLVGIDHHVEEMMELLNVDSNDVWIVGIHGMGGIGKTTIAKVIYNQLSERFDCCCFLADIREMLQHHNGLVNLQKQLISKIRKAKCLNIANADEGINMIKDTISKKKVLIVLDDVDNESQFSKLAGKRDWFVLGSRIIVTTRNKKVLNVLEVDEMYEPPPMEAHHALQLFSWHAFRRDFPVEDYGSLSREVVSTTGGLPLALEIIGSFLSGEGQVVWEETLMKLKNIPHEQVQKKLRISYEALNNEEKQIFLDIACLFIGADKTLPFYMWNDCKFNPISGINVLVLRSLVKIGDDNVLRMHDQIRDLGRAIIWEEDFKEERSRLWNHEDALEILENRTGTKKVQTLCLEGYSFTNYEFEKLPNLRFVQMNGTELHGDFKHLFPKLRWLQWHSCPFYFETSNLHLKNLVILDLYGSKIRDDWEGWSQIKVAKKLKVLNLSACCRLRNPDFSTFVTLERLILKWCINLVEIGTWIRHLINLRVLDISWSGIRLLPDAIGDLEKLEEIYASECVDFEGEIPSSIGRLSSLRILTLNSTPICSFPSSICGFSRLQTLVLAISSDFRESCLVLPPSLASLSLLCYSNQIPRLSNLMDLREFFCEAVYEEDCHERIDPRSFASFELKIPRASELLKLETLQLVKTNIRYLPREICALYGLKKLKVKFCGNLQDIPMLPSNLFNLCLSGCKSLERLGDLSNLRNLSKLKLVQCSMLEEIQGLGKLESLTSLNVSSCISLRKLDGIGRLVYLRYLNMSKCQSLVRLLGLPNLRTESLRSVSFADLSWSRAKQPILKCQIPGQSNLKFLKELVIRGLENLTKVWGLEELVSLETLDISGCKSLEEIPVLSNFKKLKRLDVSWCDNLTEIWGLEELKSIKSLDISGYRSIEKLPNLSNINIVTNDLNQKRIR